MKTRSSASGFVVLGLLFGLGLVQSHAEGSADNPGKTLKRVDGSPVAVETIEKMIPPILHKARVAGLSMAIISNSKVAYVRGFGFKDAGSKGLLGSRTVSVGASLSKPVFAYLVAALAQQGLIDLDKPLHEYLEKPLDQYPSYTDLAGDDRCRKFTAGMVLSHTTGLPNGRFDGGDGRLRILSQPGTRFSYSSEGVTLLQMVVEKQTGKGLQELAQERVFGPLEMSRTSYVWRTEFAGDVALPHDEFGRPRRLRKDPASAAGSLLTTAGDYATLVASLLGGRAKPDSILEMMLKPRIAVASETMFGPGARQDTGRYRAIGLSWGLGWGLFESPHGRAFFHTGHTAGVQNYVVVYPDAGVGIVLLSNSDNFEGVAQEILAGTIGDTFSPFPWLGYRPFDPANLRTPPPDKKVVEVAPRVLDTYAGGYLLDIGRPMRIEVKRDGSKLLMLLGEGDWNELLAESETTFFMKYDDVVATFLKDPAGAVSGLDIDIQGMTLHARRDKPGPGSSQR